MVNTSCTTGCTQELQRFDIQRQKSATTEEYYEEGEQPLNAIQEFRDKEFYKYVIMEVPKCKRPATQQKFEKLEN
jgi:hypothetical protein